MNGRNEAGCSRCERTNNPVWFAPSPLWNQVMRGPDDLEAKWGIICPPCFAELAEARGVVPTAWQFHPEPPERRVPVQRDDHSGAGTVPWSTHVRAWQNYGTRHSQTAERMAERGGFGYREMQCALAGHYNRCDSCTAKHPVPDGWEPIR